MSFWEDAGFDVLREAVEAGAAARCAAAAQKLRQRLFLQQINLIADPARHKVLLCPRRSGKSYALAVYMLIVALERSNANIVFIARTRDKAKEILWDTAETSLKKLNKDFELGLDFSEVHTHVRTPNNSRIRLRGCETIADVEQFRGEPFHLVVIDECASFAPGVLTHLINRAIEPTLGDFLGSLVLAGTPGPILSGPFYQASGDPAFEITEGRAMSRPFADRMMAKWATVEFSWSFHSWTRRDNVVLPHLWQEAERVRIANAWSEQNPNWIREYLGRWVPDDSTLVYKFSGDRNVWTPGRKTPSNPFGMPDGHAWRYVLGMDFGTKDPFALQVAAFSDTHPHLFQAYEYVERGLLPAGFAAAVKRVQELVEIEWMVGDFGPFGDMLQGQLLAEHGLNVEKAIKKDKRDHIELLNGDFLDGRCFMLADSEATRQMLHLSWDDTGLKEAIRGGIRNDAADAFVYTWRRALHHFSGPAPAPGPAPGTPEFSRIQEDQEIERVAMREIRSYHPDAEFLMDNDRFSEDEGWL